MEKNVIFVGLDVDSKNYHACLIDQKSGEMFGFKCIADLPPLLKHLRKFKKKDTEIKLCYEAGFNGFSLCRDLNANGIYCEVIAPSSIPKSPDRMVKTDRLDAERLAEFYMKGLLTVVYVPDENTEADRYLLRSRRFLVQQQTSLKYFITAYCRRIRLNYKEFTGSKKYWTGEHLKWITDKIGALENESDKASLILLMKQYRQNFELIADFDAKLDDLARTDRYKEQVAALSSFRGLSTNFSLVLITEIGDIKRFPHPNKLTSYAGMDIIEYASGGRGRKYGITKTGNSFIRTAAVEACQRVDKTPRATKHLIARRRDLESKPIHIDVADRCMRRLYKKSTRMIQQGKHINKVKVACAREFLGFVWEALQKCA